MKYRLKHGISKKRIRETVSELLPGQEIPKPSQCVMNENGRDYVMEFASGDCSYRASVLVMCGQALCYLHRRQGLGGQFEMMEKITVPYEYLSEKGLIERM